MTRQNGGSFLDVSLLLFCSMLTACWLSLSCFTTSARLRTTTRRGRARAIDNERRLPGGCGGRAALERPRVKGLSDGKFKRIGDIQMLSVIHFSDISFLVAWLLVAMSSRMRVFF